MSHACAWGSPGRRRTSQPALPTGARMQFLLVVESAANQGLRVSTPDMWMRTAGVHKGHWDKAFKVRASSGQWRVVRTLVKVLFPEGIGRVDKDQDSRRVARFLAHLEGRAPGGGPGGSRPGRQRTNSAARGCKAPGIQVRPRQAAHAPTFPAAGLGWAGAAAGLGLLCGL